MERILALYDSDILYATRFMEYFNNRNETEFEIVVFTRRDSMDEFLQTHFVDILLSGDQVDLDEETLKRIKYIYQLTDNTYAVADNSQLQINKYQSVKALMNMIIADYKEKENITQIKNSSNQMNIISIFSPVPSLEKLSFAWALGLKLSEQDNVLLILLDLLPTPLISQFDNENQSLSEYIYYLKEDSSSSKLKTLLVQNGRLSYLSGILHGADILSLSKEDIQRWVQELRTSSELDTVVFYLGCYTEATIELMNLSDKVLVTSLVGTYEAAVLKEWERQMSQLDISLKQEKFEFICLQGQENPGQVPLNVFELKDSVSWYDAEQYLNS